MNRNQDNTNNIIPKIKPPIPVVNKYKPNDAINNITDNAVNNLNAFITVTFNRKIGEGTSPIRYQDI